MPSIPSSRPRWRLVPLFAVLILVAMSVQGTSGPEPARINACVNTATGDVRIVSAGTSCRSNERAASWIQDLPPRTYTVAVAVDGVGSVTSAALASPCTSLCLIEVAAGQAISFAAQGSYPATNFGGWGGACTGSGGCQVTVNGPVAVTAAFAPSIEWVLVEPYGDASGRVVSTPAGIDCPGQCMGYFAHGSEVTLTSSADNGVALIGGFPGIPCIRAPSGSCTFVADGTTFAKARFERLHSLVVANVAGGTTSKSPAPQSCALNSDNQVACLYIEGTTVHLQTTPRGDDVLFRGWTGDCTGEQMTCDLVMTQDRYAQPVYSAAWRLSVGIAGAGQGSVVNSDWDINCSSTCSRLIPVNTQFTLEAVPAAGWTFQGWNGDCAGQDETCTLIMGYHHSAYAVFVQPSG